MAERERIARDLHDTLLQSFHGLLLQLQSVANQLAKDLPARSGLERIMDRTEAALIEGRQRVQDLRKADGDLVSRLSCIAEEFDRGPSLSVSVEGQRRELVPPIFDEVSTISAEALRNAFKHSRAEAVHVIIAYHDRHLRVTVTDDGCGLASASSYPPGHFGLIGMQERAQRIGARLSIQSAGEKGCEVDLIVPGKLAYPRVRRRSSSLAPAH
jgi:signal transduction histidine kinase